MPKTKVTGHSYTQSNHTFGILSPDMGTETGDNTGNTLYGGSTNDTLYGAGGDDYLYDQRGNDKV